MGTIYHSCIQVRDLENNILYLKKCNGSKAEQQKEIQDFVLKYSTSKKSWKHISLLPLRTDDKKSFAKDLFLPSFFNTALNIKDVVLKIIVAIGAIIFDLMTLPIRICTAPFRVWYDKFYPEKPHPLEDLFGKEELIGKSQLQKVLKERIVKIVCCEEVIRVTPSQRNEVDISHATRQWTKKIAIRRVPESWIEQRSPYTPSKDVIPSWMRNASSKEIQKKWQEGFLCASIGKNFRVNEAEYEEFKKHFALRDISKTIADTKIDWEKLRKIGKNGKH